jgi:hypothetical protein
MDIVVYKECKNIVSILLSYSFLFGQFEHLFFFFGMKSAYYYLLLCLVIYINKLLCAVA